MVTPEAIYGVEIKSDADTYTRLKRQVRDYNEIGKIIEAYKR